MVASCREGVREGSPTTTPSTTQPHLCVVLKDYVDRSFVAVDVMIARVCASYIACPGEMEGEEGQTTDVRGKVDLRLPASTFLTVAPTSEDEIATYMSEHPELNTQQSGQAVSLSSPGSHRQEVRQPVQLPRNPALRGLRPRERSKFSPGRTTSGVRHGGPDVTQRFARDLPLRTLDMRLTVKCCRKNVCDDVCAQLADTFRELVEGPLR